MRAAEEASDVPGAEQDAQALGAGAGRPGTLESAGGEPWPPPGSRDIDARLYAVRARLKTLRERDLDAGRGSTGGASERLAAARRHAAEAHASAARVLAASAETFRKAAEAHERAARMHETTAASGAGNVVGHERQATLHRAAAAADRRRAERAQLLLSGHQRAGPAANGAGPGDGGAP
jgi:hypothetical protein